MADPLYLSLWFPDFEPISFMPRVLSVMQRFPFSALRPGVEYLSIQPVSWSESTVLERRFRPGVDPDEAAQAAADFLHPDYGYIFEIYWDLWTPASALQDHDSPLPDHTTDALFASTASADTSSADTSSADTWTRQPSLVKIIAQGEEFDDGSYEQYGHIQVDFGLDTPFLYEGLRLAGSAAAVARSNIQKLVDFTSAVEKNCGVSGRLLWSESQENLAQKLLARLQQVQ